MFYFVSLYQDYRQDLITFLKQYSGAQLRVLELRNMDDPLEMRYVNEECPNLERLRIMLCGILDANKGAVPIGAAVTKIAQEQLIDKKIKNNK
jgi:hypothetical protein